MIKTIQELRNIYKEYADVKGKIMREVRNGSYIPVVRGLYETDKQTPGYCLSSYIYGPSYLSFEYALAYYGLIPEKAVVYTSATYNKRKTKTYKTYFGNYVYKDVPKSAYPYDINAIEENGYVYHIATKEKALCDVLYDKKPVTSMKQLKELLFIDLRIDEDIFLSLDMDKLIFLISKYRSKNLNILMKYITEVLDANN